MRKLLACALFLLPALCSAANPYAGKFYAAGDPKKPQFALTFDDGPGMITEDLLKLLERRGAKASFFMLGTAARSFPDRVRKVAEGGHLVCNHTDTHLLWKKEAKKPGYEQRLLKELERAEASIKNASGVTTWLLRMPNGYDAPWVRKTAQQAGYTIVNWTYGSDWVKASEERMAADYLKAVRPGAILLMHDGGGKNRVKNLALVEKILDEAARKGLKPVRLDELLGLAAAK